MGETSRRLVALLLTVLLFAAPVPTAGADGACDARTDHDGDGDVDGDDAEHCEAAHAERPKKAARDCDGDGIVDDREASQERCPEPRKQDDGARRGLDCDRDGRLDEKERGLERCPERTERVRDRCDLDGDGRVDEDEAERCRAMAAQQRDVCDHDGDGAVDRSEAQRCKEMPAAAPPRDPCDADADGRVTREEADACRDRFRDACDHDGDGRVGEFERRKCGDEHQEFEPRPASDACRDAVRANDEARNAFREAQKARWEAFATEQKQEAEEFAADKRTEEEWTAFRKEQEAERRGFEDEMREARDAFEASLAKPDACVAQGHPAAAPCAPDPADYERFKRLVDEEDARFRADVETRVAKFEERQREAVERAASGNLSEEELSEIKERLARDRHRFEAQLDEARLRHRQHLDGMWQRFNAQAGKACVGDVPRVAAPAMIHAEVRHERFGCKLDAQARIDAFYAEHGSDAAAWDDATSDAYVALKTDLRRRVHECESRLHEAWKDEVKAHFRNETGAQRFGHFEVERDGDDAGTVSGRFVTFDYETGSLILRDYSVQGLLVFEEFYAPHDGIRPEAHGSTLVITGVYENPDADLYVEEPLVADEPEPATEEAATSDEAEDADAETDEDLEEAEGSDAEEADEEETSTDAEELPAESGGAKGTAGTTHLHVKIHDAPSGGIDLGCATRSEVRMDEKEGGAQACFLTLADGATVAKAEEAAEETKHYRVLLGDKKALLRVHGPHYWDDEGTTLEFYGAANLLVPSENFVHEFANRHRAEINGAVEQGAVLAEVDIVASDEGLAAEAQDLQPADAETEVEVAEPEAGDGVAIVVDAEASAGKTGVFNVDAGAFEVEDLTLVAPEDFVVTFWNVDDDGTKTLVEIAQADDLADVLDPSEDAPEYWIVLDKDGVQVLVSFPHFSTHEVHVQSARVQPAGGDDATAARTPFAGAVAVLAAVGVAALVAGRRR